MRVSTLLALAACLALPAMAQTPQPLPFTQDWTNTGLITADDDWSGVPGIVGYRGDNFTAATNTDPQTLLADTVAAVVDVNANRDAPDTFTSGGVTEFEIANPVVALQGSGTADAPHLLIRVNTTGAAGVRVQYNVRDVDGAADDATQQVALQYRVGTTGMFTNVPAAYIADATTANTATQVTPVNVTLPANAANQPSVDIRIITTNAIGSDEWVGIDDIVIQATTVAGEDTPGTPALALAVANPVVGAASVRFNVPTVGDLALYSLTGRRVATLATAAASGTATLDTRALAAGTYVLRLDAAGETLTRLVTVVR